MTCISLHTLLINEVEKMEPFVNFYII